MLYVAFSLNFSFFHIVTLNTTLQLPTNAAHSSASNTSTHQPARNSGSSYTCSKSLSLASTKTCLRRLSVVVLNTLLYYIPPTAYSSTRNPCTHTSTCYPGSSHTFCELLPFCSRHISYKLLFQRSYLFLSVRSQHIHSQPTCL